MANLKKNTVEFTSVRVSSPSSSSSSNPPQPPPPPPPQNPKANSNDCTDCGSAKFMLQNYSNFSHSASPVRIMYYKDGSWLDFPSTVLRNTRVGFSERKPVIQISMDDDSIYFFDFMRMLQIDAVTESKRSIAWIDENGKCFFPKTFVSDDFEDFAEKSENPKIEIEIKIGGGCSSAAKRKREGVELVKEEAEVSSHEQGGNENDVIKRQRFVVTADAESSRWSNARLLRENEKAFVLVKDYFMAGIQAFDAGAVITAIHQYKGEGPMERGRCEDFEHQIEITRASRGVANTVYAWYAGSAKEVESVLAYGFGAGKVSGFDSYGVGVYLSPLGLPYLSARLAETDDNGEKHVILCRVILGALEKVEAGSRQSHPSSEDFDNGVDDPENPKWYVVWATNMNKHMLPECVVSFKSSNPLQSRLRGLTNMKFSWEELLSKLTGSLPPPKVQLLQALYDNFKAGKETRDVFLKHLRSVVGDEVMLSIIREIRANK